jgi:uncharacterized protein (DUF2384 family)
MATPAITLPATLTEFLRLSVKTVERGVPLSKFQTFALKSGLPLKELHEVVIPPRTLKHRKARKPKERYQGRTPLELLRTEAGGREVDNFLGQIDYGMFA